MSAHSRVLSLTEHDDRFSPGDQFALDVLLGLSGDPKTLPSKYFYDDEGSALFERIMDLPEYYLTACEEEILRTQRDAIVQSVGNRAFDLIDLGAGNGRKAKILIERFLAFNVLFRYMPVDICANSVRRLGRSLERAFPGLAFDGIAGEYFPALRWLSRAHDERKLVLFLGSNIGNFRPEQARDFLRGLWYSLNPGDLVLIGFDLRKQVDLLMGAYDDPAGVTRDFNLNLLRRINRELHADFDVARFRHHATYDASSSAMESYLVSTERQAVSIGAARATIQLDAWEPIQTECSVKFAETDIEELALETGFCVAKNLFDARRFFCDSLWEVRKSAATLSTSERWRNIVH